MSRIPAIRQESESARFSSRGAARFHRGCDTIDVFSGAALKGLFFSDDILLLESQSLESVLSHRSLIIACAETVPNRFSLIKVLLESESVCTVGGKDRTAFVALNHPGEEVFERRKPVVATDFREMVKK